MGVSPRVRLPVWRESPTRITSDDEDERMPPKKTGKNVRLGEILGLDALALLKKPSFAIFIACMFLICVPLYFYFVNMNLYVTELGWSYTAAKMSLAQVSDVVFLILLPLMLRTLGYKKTIFLGILAWVTRYFLLASSVSQPGIGTVLGLSVALTPPPRRP